MIRRKRCRRDGGQELVEYALVLPVLLLLILGIIEFAILIFAYDTIANAAREGVRAGVVPSGTVEIAKQAAKDRALALDADALIVEAVFTEEGTVEVTVTYDFTLMTAPIIAAVGGDPGIPLRTVATMIRE